MLCEELFLSRVWVDDEHFRTVRGEFAEDLLEADGELCDPVDIFFKLEVLRRSTLSGVGCCWTIGKSATRGDSVSLNAKSSVSVCFEALITSTHFSVQTPISRNFFGAGGSSMTLQSPTATVLLSGRRVACCCCCCCCCCCRSLSILHLMQLTSALSSLHCKPTEMTNGVRFSFPTWHAKLDTSTFTLGASP